MQINLVFSLEEILLVYVINGLFWGIICHFVAKSKNNSGFWWGFFLGLIGLIVVACASPKEQELKQEISKFNNLGVADDGDDNYRDEEVISETAPMLKRCPQCGAEMQVTLEECSRCGYRFDKKTKVEPEKEKKNLGLTVLKIVAVALICGFLGYFIPTLIMDLTTPVYVAPTYTPNNNTSNINNTTNNESNTAVTRKDINDYVENRVLYEDDKIAVTITNINGLETFSFQLKNKSEREL